MNKMLYGIFVLFMNKWLNGRWFDENLIFNIFFYLIIILNSYVGIIYGNLGVE